MSTPSLKCLGVEDQPEDVNKMPKKCEVQLLFCFNIEILLLLLLLLLLLFIYLFIFFFNFFDVLAAVVVVVA